MPINVFFASLIITGIFSQDFKFTIIFKSQKRAYGTLRNETLRNIAKRNIAKHCDTRRNIAKHCETLRNIAKHCETSISIIPEYPENSGEDRDDSSDLQLNAILDILPQEAGSRHSKPITMMLNQK